MDIPPRLVGDIPDFSSRIPAQARTDAAADWPTWWDRLARFELRQDEVAGDPATIRHHFGQLTQLVDPPNWDSLSDWPALRAAAQAVFEEGYRWANRALEPLKPPDQSRQLFLWKWVRDVAEQVAHDHDVDVGAVRGSAQLLLVTGRWWRLIDSGRVLCSADAAEDEATARRVLRLAFESAVAD